MGIKLMVIVDGKAYGTFDCVRDVMDWLTLHYPMAVSQGNYTYAPLACSCDARHGGNCIDCRMGVAE